MKPQRLQKSLTLSYLIYGAGVVILGLASSYSAICFAMFLGGTGWLILATLMNMSSRQITGASQLKATMLGVFLAVFYAGMALGAVTWGAFARIGSTRLALITAGSGLLTLGLVKMKFLKVR